jgi:hypothetical protein
MSRQACFVDRQQQVVISKSIGVTESERLLAEFCERSFLKLWSYPNPCKDDGKLASRHQSKTYMEASQSLM